MLEIKNIDDLNKYCDAMNPLFFNEHQEWFASVYCGSRVYSDFKVAISDALGFNVPVVSGGAGHCYCGFIAATIPYAVIELKKAHDKNGCYRCVSVRVEHWGYDKKIFLNAISNLELDLGEKLASCFKYIEEDGRGGYKIDCGYRFYCDKKQPAFGDKDYDYADDLRNRRDAKLLRKHI